MNFRTTLFLFAALAGLVLGYVLLRPGDSAATTATTADDEAPVIPASAAARKLVEEPIDEPVKVVVTRGDEEWVFERRTDAEVEQPGWYIVEPFEARSNDYDIDRFGNQLLELQYELSYKPGTPGAVTAEEAGLSPPEAVVAMTDDKGKTITVEIGHPASDRETYVRLAGHDEIVRATSSLRYLLKSKAIEYRNVQLWELEAADVTKVEITDNQAEGGPVNYVFVRDGSQWRMEAPAAAKVTNKVEQMVGMLARLRFNKWVDDSADQLPMYGLDDPALVVRATVEEEKPAEEPTDGESADASENENADDAAEPEEGAGPPKVVTKTYVLHIADRSPIGEDSRVYARTPDEPAVGTLMKTQADRFRPVMSEWREMQVTTANIRGATRVELTQGGKTLALVKDAGKWTFEADGAAADTAEVSSLLNSIANLTAVAYVDGVSGDLAPYGLEQPTAEVRLTVPGQDEPERIAVGAPTDQTVKRLVYVRRSESTSIAKVKVEDVKALEREPAALRDRTIFDVNATQIQEITISRGTDCTETPLTVTYRKGDDAWSLAAPVEAEIQKEEFGKLLTALARLKGTTWVAGSDAASAYGLDNPGITVTFTHQPPKGVRLEPAPAEPQTDAADAEQSAEDETAAEDEDVAAPETSDEEAGTSDGAETPDDAPEISGGDGQTRMVPVEFQPPAETLTLRVAQHEGRWYALREGGAAALEVAADFVGQLQAEYRTKAVWTIDDMKVNRLALTTAERSDELTKRDNKWHYTREPDLPLDDKKVRDLLTAIKGLETSAYVAYGESALADAGLTSPAVTLEIGQEGGTTHKLLVSGTECTAGTVTGRPAAIDGQNAVFLLAPDSADRCAFTIAGLEKE